MTAIQTWPVGMPFYAERGSFNEVPESNRSEFKPDVGQAKRRRRSSIATRLLTFTMLLSNAQYESLMTYYTDTLGDGSDNVGPVAHPISGATMNFQFVTEPSIADYGYDKNRVTMSIRKLP